MSTWLANTSGIMKFILIAATASGLVIGSTFLPQLFMDNNSNPKLQPNDLSQDPIVGNQTDVITISNTTTTTQQGNETVVVTTTTQIINDTVVVTTTTQTTTSTGTTTTVVTTTTTQTTTTSQTTTTEPVTTTTQPVIEGTILSSGTLETINANHYGVGWVHIVQDSDGDIRLQFTDVVITEGPDLNIYLSEKSKIGGALAPLGEFIDLGNLPLFSGTFSVRISSSLDLDLYNSVVIYCVLFSSVFTWATLTSV